MRLLKTKSTGRGIARTAETARAEQEAVRNEEENVRKRQKTTDKPSTIRRRRSSSTSSTGNGDVPAADIEPDEVASNGDEDEGEDEIFESSPQLPPPPPIASTSVKGKAGGSRAGKEKAGTSKEASRREERSASILRATKAFPGSRRRRSSSSSTSSNGGMTIIGTTQPLPPIESGRQQDPRVLEEINIDFDDDDEMDASPPPSSIRKPGPKSRMSGRNEQDREEMTKKKKSQVKVNIERKAKPKVRVHLQQPSAILEEDSDDEGTTERNKSRGYAGGEIETSSLTSITTPTRRRRLSSSLLVSSDDETSSRAMSNGSTIVSSQSGSTQGGSQRSTASRFNPKSWNTSIIAEKEKHDPNDSEWLTFTSHVKNSPASAHERLKDALLEAGSGATKCTALLGKLICRSIRDPEDGDSDSKEFLQKCAATIIRSVFHLTTCHENKDAAVVEELVRMLFQELRHFPTAVLKSIGESCMDYIKTEKDRDDCLPPRWIEVFGKIVSVLIGKGDIKVETDIIEGKAYREYVISGICRLKWTTANSASLLAILREIPEIEDSDLKLVLCHVRACAKNIKASGFPPIVHQLTLLVGSRFPLELLSIAAEYFKADNTVTPLEVKQKRNALGTVVYHFLETARHSDILVKAVVKILKSSFFDFGKVMNPFILSVVLGLAQFDYVKPLIIDPLRNSIMKAFHSMHLSGMSYWYQHTAGCADDTVTECFKAILETKSSESEFLFNGLRELGIGLLNADLYQKQYPNTLRPCQKLGSYIITSLVRNNQDQLPFMMKDLLRLSSKSVVHVQCLATCLEMRTRQVIHPSVIGSTCEIVRHLPMMDCDSATLIVKALATAFQLSYTLLDQLMIILRKTIWKSVEARRTAARTMIILLSNSKVVGDIPSSQFSESQRFSSQSQNHDEPLMNPDQLPDNQPLCLEILSLTKRCFDQQSEIKKELYLGFHSVVRRNPGICELLCSQLYIHGKRFLPSAEGDDESEPAIDFKTVVEFPVNDIFNSVKIKEELGFMVQCLSHVVRKSHKAFASIDEGPPEIVDKVENLVKLWVKAVLLLTPDSLEIAAAEAVASAGGSRPLDTVRYVETLFVIQTLQIIEALIEFLNYKENRESESVVKKLFEKYKLLEPLLQKKKEPVSNKKGKGDKKKGGANKTKDKDKDNSNDDISIVDTGSQASSGVGLKFKRPDAPKKLSYFHIFNLENLLEMLKKLYKSDPDKRPFTSVHRNSSDFEKMLLDAVKQKLASFKKGEPLHERIQQTEKLVETFADIASCIWNGLCNQDHENSEDTCQVTADVTQMRLETIEVITEHLCSCHESACTPMIKKFGDEVDEALSYDQAFPKFFNSWKTLQGWIPSNPDGEENRDLHKFLFYILQSFSKPMSPDSADRTHSRKVLNWLWTYMSSSSGKGDQQAEFDLADSVVSCWLAYYVKAKGFLEQPGQSQHDILSLSRTVRGSLGDNQFMETQAPISHVEMWIVNGDTAATILVRIMDFIEVVLGHIVALLGKLKSQQVEDDEEAFKKADSIRERCFNMMNQILTVCSNLVCSRFPGGIFSTTMLKIIPQIFTAMTGFAEHLVELSKTKADYSIIKSFVGPVNVIGKEFQNSVELMIQHIESVQREEAKKAIAKAKSGGRKMTGQVPNSVKNLLGQDKKLIPSMVYTLEKYDQQIFTLSNKLKNHKGAKLVVGMKLTSARDFKIDGNILKEAFRAQGRPRSVEELSSVADDVTVIDAEPQPGPSRPRSRNRKRKTTESESGQDAE